MAFVKNYADKSQKNELHAFYAVSQKTAQNCFVVVVVWQHKLGEVENEYTSHNCSLFTIFPPKIIEIGGNLTKFWQKQFCTVFLRHGVLRLLL